DWTRRSPPRRPSVSCCRCCSATTPPLRTASSCSRRWSISRSPSGPGNRIASRSSGCAEPGHTTITTVHHLYRRPGDLLPACGVTPGPDRALLSTAWHTGHVLEELLECQLAGAVCCMLCLQLSEPELDLLP